MIRITAKTEGFRRCGVAHSATPTDYPDDRFNKKELEALKAEPELSVEYIAPEPGEKGKGKGKGKTQDPPPQSEKSEQSDLSDGTDTELEKEVIDPDDEGTPA